MPNHTGTPINPGSTLDITADVNQAVNALRTIDAFLKRTQRTVRNFNKDLNAAPDLDFRRATRGLNQFNNSMQRANVFVGSFLANIASNLVPVFTENIVGASIELEALRARFVALNRTAEEGQESFERIFETSQELGASFDAVLAGATRLRNYGFESAAEIESLSRTIAVLSGGSAMAVERLVRALSQVVGSGRVAQEELNQFSEIIPIIRSIAEVTGIAEGRIRELVAARDQAINPDVIIAALRNLEQGTFGRAAEAQAESVAASINRLQNEFSLLGQTLVREFSPTLIRILETLQRIAPVFGTFFDLLNSPILQGTAAFLGLNKFADILNNRLIPTVRNINGTYAKYINISNGYKEEVETQIKQIKRQDRSYEKLVNRVSNFTDLSSDLGRAQDRTTKRFKQLSRSSSPLVRLWRSLQILMARLIQHFNYFFTGLISGGVVLRSVGVRVTNLWVGIKNFVIALATVKGAVATAAAAIGTTLVAATAAAITSMQRAKAEIREFNEELKNVVPDEELRGIQKAFIDFGDFINRTFYLPVRRGALADRVTHYREQARAIEEVIKAQKEEQKALQEHIAVLLNVRTVESELTSGSPFLQSERKGPVERFFGQIRIAVRNKLLERLQREYKKLTRSIEDNIVALEKERTSLERAERNYARFYRNFAQITRSFINSTLISDIHVEGMFGLDHIKTYVLPQWQKDLQELREEYNKFVNATERRALFGLLDSDDGALETDINKLRRHIQELQAFLNSVASNKNRIPLVPQLQEQIDMLALFKKQLEELELQKTIKDLLETYDDAVLNTALRRSLGIITTEADLYRQSISNVEALIEGFLQEDIPLDQIQDAVAYLVYAKEKLEDITSRRVPNEALDNIREVRQGVVETLTNINTEYQTILKYAKTYNELEAGITNNLQQQYDLYRSTLSELNNLLGVTSKQNQAYSILQNYITFIENKLEEIALQLPRTTGAVKDLRSEIEKFFNIDTSTGFGDFLGPDNEFGRALKSIEKVLDVVERVGNSIGSLMNTITQTISNLIDRQVQQMQDKLDALADSRRKAEEEFRRQLQKEEEGLRRQFEAGIITFEKYYENLDQARRDDEKKRNELRNKEIDVENKINAARHAAEVQAFNYNKLQSLAQLAFNSAIAITRAFADFPYPVALGIAGLIGGTALAQKALILAQQPPPPPRVIDKLAEGGIITRRQYVEVGEGVKPNKELILPLNKKTLQRYGLGGGPNITVIYKGTVIEEKQAAKTLEGILKKSIHSGRIGSLR